MWSHPEVDEWWAHFAHAFDTLHLAAAAYRLNWRVRGSIAGQGPIAIEMSPPDETRWVSIRDFFRIMVSTLGEIADNLHLPSQKLFTKADYDGDMRDMPLERLREGNLTDCRLILEAMDVLNPLLTQFDGHLKATFSATALTVVKSHLKATKVKLPSMAHTRGCKRKQKAGEACACYWSANVTAEKGYYGARVEVFHHARAAPQTEYDFSSMYPWAQSQELPMHWTGNVTGRAARAAFASGVFGVYEAEVRVPKAMWLPPLPYRLEGGGLYFPTGSWRAHFPACELQYVQSLGCEVTVQAGVTYSSGKPFEGYIAKLYEYKRTATGAFRELVKRLLVGSYGKFAEKPDREGLLFIPNLLEAMHYQWSEPGIRPLNADVDPRILGQSYQRYAKHAHYAIGAYITGLARVRLHQFALLAEGLSYVDTDSLHCLHWEGETGNALGQLKVELRDFLGRYYAPKLYALYNPADPATILLDEKGRARVACKGFLKGTQEDFESVLESARTFHALIEAGASQGLAKDAARGMGQSLVRTRLFKSQWAPGADHTEVLRLRQAKSWSGLSRKRRPDMEGGTTPWAVGDLVAGRHLSARCPIL